MKNTLFTLALLFAVATCSHAQSTSSSWIDVTAPPYLAVRDCSADASSAIKNAISGAPAGSGVIFFPTGCYLIKTQIVDTNSSASLTYLAEGQVEFRASTTTPPTSSIIQFGNDTTHVSLRKIVGIYFDCNGDTIDGIDLDGLVDSEFDSITIYNCKGSSHWAMATVGNNANEYNNTVYGGVIEAAASGDNGIELGPYANAWSFFGTKVLGFGSGSTGTGLDLAAVGFGFYGGVVSNWQSGINVVVNNPSGTHPRHGFEISGNYMENNNYAAIRVGNAGNSLDKANGITITGNYITCGGVGQYGIVLQQANGFNISGNSIQACTSDNDIDTEYAIWGYPDGLNQGADNGFVGANSIDSSPVLLQGSNNTVTNFLSTKSSVYTLSGTDAWVNVTGTTTITVPHAMTAQRWDVFNSGTGTVTLICDSGTINGLTAISTASETGKTVTTDGTNCFAH